LNKIAEYRRTLISQDEMSEEQSSVLIVVGRKDTGDLEAQIRGSRHAWDIRLLSVDALLRLMTLKENLEDPQTIHRIHEILIPREFTKLDEIVEILFSTAEEAKQEELPEAEEQEEEVSQARGSPKAFHEACVTRIEEHLDENLVRRVRTGYVSPDDEMALTCLVSKEYHRGDHPSYWFGFHLHQKDFLEQAQRGFLALGCGSEKNVLLIPLGDLERWLEDLSTTERDGGMYWHFRIHHYDGQWLLDRKGKNRLDVTEYLLA
jgi:hypothetical protein